MANRFADLAPPSVMVGSSPLIIKGIAEYLPMSDIKNFRLVNSNWEEDVHSVFLRRSVVPLSTFLNLDSYIRTVPAGTHKHFDFKAFLHSSGMEYRVQSPLVPMTGFDVIERLHPQIMDTIQAFFQKYGPKMKYLRLRMRWENARDYSMLLDCLNKLPNLVELDLRILVYCTPEVLNIPVVISRVKKLTIQLVHPGYRVNPINFNLREWAAVIPAIFPTITTLIVGDHPFLSQNANLLNNLVDYAHLFQNLDDLRIIDAKSSVASVVAKFPQNLKSLCIKFSTAQISFPVNIFTAESDKALEDALIRHSQSLESLSLTLQARTVTRNTVKLSLNFPRVMPHLKQLDLNFICHHMKNQTRYPIKHLMFPIKPLQYDQQFPMLESLNMDGTKREDFLKKLYRKLIPRLRGSQRLSINIKDLKLVYPYDEILTYKRDEDLLARLTSVFPSACSSGIDITKHFNPKPQFSLADASNVFDRNAVRHIYY